MDTALLLPSKIGFKMSNQIKINCYLSGWNNISKIMSMMISIPKNLKNKRSMNLSINLHYLLKEQTKPKDSSF